MAEASKGDLPVTLSKIFFADGLALRSKSLGANVSLALVTTVASRSPRTPGSPRSSRLRGRLAVSCTIPRRKMPHVREAPLQRDILDRQPVQRRRQFGMRRFQADLAQIGERRVVSKPAKSILQRSHADPGCFRHVAESQRLMHVGMHEINRFHDLTRRGVHLMTTQAIVQAVREIQKN